MKNKFSTCLCAPPPFWGKFPPACVPHKWAYRVIKSALQMEPAQEGTQKVMSILSNNVLTDGLVSVVPGVVITCLRNLSRQLTPLCVLSVLFTRLLSSSLSHQPTVTGPCPCSSSKWWTDPVWRSQR